MLDQAKEPEVGVGPYGVERSDDDGFFYITRDGARAEGFNAYPLGKTAYRKARQLNDARAASAETDARHPPTPPVGESPKAKPARRAKADPKPEAPKRARKGKVTDEPEVELPTKRHGQGTPTNLVLFTGTREEWMNAFAEAARPYFAEAGYPLPDKVHCSMGFMFRASKAWGQCWRPEASADGVSQIFINPILSGEDSITIAGVLTHELCHAATPGAKHGPAFKKAAEGVGMEGKAPSIMDGPGWREWAEPLVARLGRIPHAAIDPKSSGVKKQSTRLLKGTCKDCGFTVRLTAKWVNAAQGELQCPDTVCSGPLEVELTGGGEGE